MFKKIKKLNKALLAVLIFIILILAGILVWQKTGINQAPDSKKLININSEWSPQNLSEKAETYSVSSGDDYPLFANKLIIDPLEVTEGDTQHFSVWAKDSKGIETVILSIKTDEEENKIINFTLEEGESENGRWEGEWKVNNVKTLNSYPLIFNATNIDGETTQLNTSFDINHTNKTSLLKQFFNIKTALADECLFSDIGSVDLDLASECYIDTDDVVGVNEGDLYIRDVGLRLRSGSQLTVQGGDINIDGTVTMDSGTTIVFNQGQSIYIGSGYILKSDDNTIIRKGTANFYQLNVYSAGTGSGTVNLDPPDDTYSLPHSRYYIENTSVTLTAIPSTDSIFSGWSGSCSGTGSCVVSMTAARSVTANFAINTYTLSVSKSGLGTITSSPSGISCGTDCSQVYDYGTSVTLSATPSTGYSFSGWSGSCSGTGSCVVSMTAARSVTANFAISCECSSGDCCSDGCNWDSSSTICDSTYATDYGCPWGTGCGADVGRRYQQRYCSGTSATCSGTISSWGSYSTYDNCGTTETCSDNDSSCNYTSSCDVPAPFRTIATCGKSCNQACNSRGGASCVSVELYPGWTGWYCNYCYECGPGCSACAPASGASCSTTFSCDSGSTICEGAHPNFSYCKCQG